MSRILSVAALLFGVGTFSRGLVTSAPKSPAQSKKIDYASEVQPIFDAHCARCHGKDARMGGLNLASVVDLLKGGVGGASAVPGNSARSLLVARLLGADGKPRMPMGFGPLAARDIATIRAWIDQGCFVAVHATARHWAYVKPVRPAIPVVKTKGWIHNPIDAFVLGRLEREGLRPSPPADRVTLIRRVTLDLIGLPPTPAEVDSFVADRSPDAYDRVVDRLFASPHYGERMALPWLDAARYADSNGFQQDGDTFQYVWRDWVVQAMNDNMPYDRFTIEQLAGDLLPTADASTEQGRAQIIASGFNRNAMLNGEGGAIAEEQRNVILFDRVDTTATTWLGLTMACARCHDHKYDPLTQRDFYRLMAYFNNVPESGVPEGSGQYRIAPPFLYAGSSSEMVKLRALQLDLDGARHEAKGTQETKPSSPEAAKLTAHVKDLEKQLADYQKMLPRVMIMSDARPRETHVYIRGSYTSPGERVVCGTPAIFLPPPPDAPANRLALARWIVSPENPLTSRVEVNRCWQVFFGQGLVRTPENFGVQGEPPTNPQLLDWLAVDFRESGWDVKRLQRMIVTSSTYRQTSRTTPALRKRDPDNRLLARGARFRLPSMILRDVALAASGLLNPAIGGKPVYPYQPKGIWDGLQITEERDFTYPQSKGADLYRRSIYSFWRRTAAPGDVFDAASRQVCTVRASHTSTPLHALTTLNDVVWVEAGRKLAERVTLDMHGGVDARLGEAFRRVCARRPTPAELAILRRAMGRAESAFAADPNAAATYLKQGDSPSDPHLDARDLAALAVVCSAILNLDEALTRE